MADEPESPVGVAGLVPHFFFDLIGRILPGAFVIIATWVIFRPNRASDVVGKIWASFFNSPKDAGPSAAMGLLLFLALIAASYFVGLYMGSLSHFFIERIIWKRKWPWSLDQIPSPFKVDPGTMEIRYCGMSWYSFNGPSTEPYEVVETLARICGMFLWAANPAVGGVTSRWDAEALASRSVALAALVLTVVSLSKCNLCGALVMGLIGVGALMTYHHVRRRHVVGKLEGTICLLPLSWKAKGE